MLHAGNTGVGYLIKKYKKTWFVVALLSAILVVGSMAAIWLLWVGGWADGRAGGRAGG
jgi:hypothetical protein